MLTNNSVQSSIFTPVLIIILVALTTVASLLWIGEQHIQTIEHVLDDDLHVIKNLSQQSSLINSAGFV
jgi:hypothetical protein